MDGEQWSGHMVRQMSNGKLDYERHACMGTALIEINMGI